MPVYRNDVDSAVEAVLSRQERSARERAERPAYINVEGLVYAVDADGQPLDERDRARVQSIAQAQADRAVTRGISLHNTKVHPTQRIDQRDATAKEVAEAHRQILEEGRYRQEHGQSCRPGVDLGDVVAGELG